MNIDDYRALYESEAEEILQALEQGLIELEASDEPSVELNGLFRAAHNLKGISGAMGYENVVEASHALESALDSIRSSDRTLLSEEISRLLDGVDSLKILVRSAGQDKPDSGRADALKKVLDVAKGLSAGIESGGLAENQGPPDSVSSEENPKAAGNAGSTDNIGQPDSSEVHTDDRIRSILESEHVTKALEEVGASIDKVFIENEIKGINRQIKTTKVDLKRLDRIMDLVGELIINRIKLGSLVEETGSKQLKDEIRASGRLVSEIQKEVMEARLIPVGHVFQRFKRMVRDLAAKRGKEIAFEIQGAEIGIDRMLLERMVDPIVHLIRNAIDHGIEAPGERAAAGKPGEGRIVLSAKRERNNIVIEVTDDGKGVDIDEVLSECRKKGVDVGDVSQLTPERLWDVLALPGFSTADAVDEISGRGIGMNVVKKTIESFGGTIRLGSRKGHGTTVSMEMPVNLSIVKALLFPVGKDIHAIPIEYVRETTRVELASSNRIGAEEVLHMPGGVLPLYTPEGLFGLAPALKNGRYMKVIVIDTGRKRAALAVDRIIGQQDIVIKALPPVISRVRGLSGVTILGNGKVAFIWEPNTLFEGGLKHESTEQTVLLEN